MNRTYLLVAMTLSLTVAAVGCNCGGSNPVITPGGEGGGSIAEDAGEDAGGGAGGGVGGGGGSTDLCQGAQDPCLLNPGICPMDCSASDTCEPSSGNWSCGCSCPDGGTIDGGVIVNDAGTPDAGGTDGGNVCNVDPCGICQAGCTANDSCANNVWTCSCSCSDGGVVDGGTVVTDGGVAPNTLCLDIAKKECDYMIRCKSETNVAGTDFTQGRANDQLATAQRATCEQLLSEDPGCLITVQSWARGRLTVDQAKYFDCINASYPANTCVRDFNDVIVKCANINFIQPGAAVGALCVTDRDCVNGYCSTNNAPACGTCQPYLATNGGAPNCTRDAQCNPATSYCPGSDSPGGTSGGQRCTNHIQNGAQCNPVNTTDQTCLPGSVCQGSQQTGFTCAAGKAENAACTKGRYECLRYVGETFPRLTCATVGGSDKCVKISAGVNGTCLTGENVPFTSTPIGPYCPETQFCSSSQCTDRRPAGQPCQATDVCAEGTRCVANVCTAYKEQGGTCAANGECKNLLGCDGGTCQPQRATLGQSCSAQVPCVAGSYCKNGSCVALEGDGGTCTNSTQCESYTCDTNAGKCAAGCWQ